MKNCAPIIVAIGLLAARPAIAVPNADDLLQAAFDNWRGKSSTTEMTMTVHRPDWERNLKMKAWTQGDNDALVRFVAPAKDAGNATLKIGSDTSVFNPKLNQVVKLPPSMMAQSWMGSDFSYNDLSKAEDVLTDYDHKILSVNDSGAQAVYTIEADPKPGAPVVWGKLVIQVREDGILLRETYFDQDLVAVRTMATEKVGVVDGRPYPVEMIMRPQDAAGSWTRIETSSGKFNLALPTYIFTLSNLQNPRE